MRQLSWVLDTARKRRTGRWSWVEYLHLQLIICRRAQLRWSTTSSRSITTRASHSGTRGREKAGAIAWGQTQKESKASRTAGGTIKMGILKCSRTHLAAKAYVVGFIEPWNMQSLLLEHNFTVSSSLILIRWQDVWGPFGHINVLPHDRRHKLLHITELSQYIKSSFQLNSNTLILYSAQKHDSSPSSSTSLV